MNSRVVDASAVLATLRGEAGGQRLSDGSGGLISAVNSAEALTRLADLGATRERSSALLDGLGLVVRPFLPDDALITAALRTSTRHLGLSLGDRACLALALREGAPVLTADRSWSELKVGVEIELIR